MYLGCQVFWFKMTAAAAIGSNREVTTRTLVASFEGDEFLVEIPIFCFFFFGCTGSLLFLVGPVSTGALV